MTVAGLPRPAPGDDREGASALLPAALASALTAIEAALDVVSGWDPRELDGPQAAEVARRVSAVSGRLTASAARLLPVVEADGLWGVDGSRSFAAWVSRELNVAARTASGQVRLGRTLRDHLPLTRAAVLSGAITVEHAQVIAALAPTTDQRREVLAEPSSEVNEAFLVEQARTLGVDDLRVLLRKWAAYTDPDADDRGYVEAVDRQHLTVSRLLDGYEVSGHLSVENGQRLKAALRAVTPVPAQGDSRDPAQRRAQALGDLAKVVLDNDLAGAGRTVRPHISVLVEHDAFVAMLASAGARRGTQGQLDAGGRPVRSESFATATMLTGRGPDGGPQYEDGTPISRAALDLLACDSAISRVIFGPDSQALDVGREERTFTGARRRALIARDKHCRFPGCTAPPVLCDGHHIDEWARDHGNTDVRRGCLLCTFHHHDVHRKGVAIVARGARLVFTDRHGVEITAAPPPTPRAHAVPPDR